MLRSAMRKDGPASRCRPSRSSSEVLNSAGGSGRIASAGGSLTACRTAPITPSESRARADDKARCRSPA